MKTLTTFFISIKKQILGLIIFITIWYIFSLFFPSYIIPSPAILYTHKEIILSEEFATNLYITLYRIFIGFTLSFIIGTLIGIISFVMKHHEIINLTLQLFQIIPGTILGVILLLVFGINSLVPISLIIILATPLISTNTSNGLIKKNKKFEQLIIGIGGGLKEIIKDVYIPALMPIFKSNLIIGFNFSLKIVILGEFIGTQSGIGYLLNVAKIYFDMDKVFYYLMIIIIIMIVYQVFINLIFILFFEKYFYPE